MKLYFASIGVHVVVSLWLTQTLPEVVSSHYNSQGFPNGTMPKTGFAAFMILLPLLASLVMVSVPRWVRPESLNVPHPEFWRSPEHFPHAKAIFQTFMIRFASLFVLFYTFQYWLLATHQRQLPKDLEIFGTGTFLLLTLLQVVWMIRSYKVSKG